MRSTLALAALAAATLVPTGLTGFSQPAGAMTAEPAAASAKHVVTFKVAGCEGCSMAVGHADPTYSDVWTSKPKEVTDGKVSFTVPAEYADTLSANVIAPWEGPIGYVTQVVFRYTGHQTGERVTLADARQQKRGSVCLKNDADASRTTLRLTIRKVEVAGQTPSGRTDGTIAFATRTQKFAKPLYSADEGVAGAQDLPPCEG